MANKIPSNEAVLAAQAGAKVSADPIEGEQDSHVGSGAADPKIVADQQRITRPVGRPQRGTHSLATMQGPLVEREDHASSGVERRSTHKQEKPKLAFQKVSSFEGYVGSVVSVVETAAPAIDRKVTLSGICQQGIFIHVNNSIRFIPWDKIQEMTLKNADV